jgi:hypothetical protein
MPAWAYQGGKIPFCGGFNGPVATITAGPVTATLPAVRSARSRPPPLAHWSVHNGSLLREAPPYSRARLRDVTPRAAGPAGYTGKSPRRRRRGSPGRLYRPLREVSVSFP